MRRGGGGVNACKYHLYMVSCRSRCCNVWFFLSDSTFRFLFEQWKDTFPPGYLLKEASIDKPFEEDACHCHFVFVQESTLSIDLDIILKYKWFLGERALSNFTAIPDVNGEVTDSRLLLVL